MKKKELTYVIGGTVGWIVGLILAKIYQIWAILYETEGMDLEGITAFSGQPLWRSINDNPGTVTLILTVFFIVLGLSFAYFFNKID